MPYRPIPYEKVKDPTKRDVFRRANMYLSDVYSMLRIRPGRGQTGASGMCNFSFALVLLCVIDGLSTGIYPTTRKARKQETRFKRLIRDKLPWGAAQNGWIEKGPAAKWLYVEFRNPLTHELGKDVSATRRAADLYQPVVFRWQPGGLKTMDWVDRQRDWSSAWPILSWQPYKTGKRLCFSGAALYWAVKKMTTDLLLLAER
jgi:hypothetical protein